METLDEIKSWTPTFKEQGWKVNQMAANETKKKTRKTRGPNWGKNEEQQLSASVLEFESVLSASHSTTITNKDKDAAWEAITENINIVGGKKRTVDEVRKKFGNWKTAVKTKAMSNKRSHGKTGGGESEEIELS